MFREAWRLSSLGRDFLAGWLLHLAVSSKQRKYRWEVQKLSRLQLRSENSPRFSLLMPVSALRADTVFPQPAPAAGFSLGNDTEVLNSRVVFPDSSASIYCG